MSMEKFLRDIEARLASERAWELEQDTRQIARVQYSTIALDDRLLAQKGGPIRVCATDMQVYEGTLDTVGEEWISIESRGESILVPLRVCSGGKGPCARSRRSPPRAIPHEDATCPASAGSSARTSPPLS